MQPFQNLTGIAFTLIVRVNCAQCGKAWEEAMQLLPGAQAFISPWPRDNPGGDWSRFGGLMLCNEHKMEVAVKVDGQEVKDFAHALTGRI